MKTLVKKLVKIAQVIKFHWECSYILEFMGDMWMKVRPSKKFKKPRKMA
jgi:hypothetical protein